MKKPDPGAVTVVGSDHGANYPEYVAGRILSAAAPVEFAFENLAWEDCDAACKGLYLFGLNATPEMVKQWEIDVLRDPDEPGPDDGVIRRNPELGQDPKVFLHYRPDLPRLLKERGVELSEWQKEWLAACSRLWKICELELYAITKYMDRRSGFHFHERAMAAREQHVLRVLHYEYLPGNTPMAKTHVDRDALSFQIYSSCPGFYSNENWIQTSHEHLRFPNAFCFPGIQLEKITEGNIPALWHGVDKPKHGPNYRYAITFFGKMQA